MHIRRYTKALRNIRVTIINKNEEKNNVERTSILQTFTFTFTFFKLRTILDNWILPEKRKKRKKKKKKE